MFSMYRAWLAAGDEHLHQGMTRDHQQQLQHQQAPVYPRGLLDGLSPPDTLVRVGSDGEYHFVAHRAVLAAHSGYLKALLAVQEDQEQHPGPAPLVTSISVPTIGGEAFAPLLGYMYTGHLDVSLDNIYAVLVATHLLHMPGALDQCRAALLRLRAVPPPPTPAGASPGTGSILRPVPSRLLGAPFCWPTQPGLFGPATPVSPMDLATQHLSNSLQLLAQPRAAFAGGPSSPVPRASRERTLSPASPASRPAGLRSATSSPELVVASSSNGSQASLSPSRVSVRPESSSHRDSSSRRRSGSRSSRGLGGIPEQQQQHQQSAGNGIVFDVACCDGPVRFHRVLNEHYVPERESRGAGPGQEVRCSRVATQAAPPRSDDEPENDENQGEGSYRCGYCKHSFKSQYCYKKHARRHLLPPAESTSGMTTPTTVAAVAGQRAREAAQSQESKKQSRQVRLLDLNVQYYPCKICGSKFPSYYFVHKHRKLCHPNADEPAKSAGNIVTEEDSKKSTSSCHEKLQQQPTADQT